MASFLVCNDQGLVDLRYYGRAFQGSSYCSQRRRQNEALLTTIADNESDTDGRASCNQWFLLYVGVDGSRDGDKVVIDNVFDN